MKATVKSHFTVITDKHRRYDFEAGEQEIPAEVANHWYVKAHIEPQAEVYDAPEAAPLDEPEARKTLKAKK